MAARALNPGSNDARETLARETRACRAERAYLSHPPHVRVSRAERSHRGAQRENRQHPRGLHHRTGGERPRERAEHAAPGRASPGVRRLEDIARVDVRDGRAIVSFIADVARSTELIARVFTVLAQRGVKVEMLSQGASKVNISLVVLDADAEEALRIIHDEFFSTSKEAVASR